MIDAGTHGTIDFTAGNDIKIAKRLIERGIAVRAEDLADQDVNLKKLLRG